MKRNKPILIRNHQLEENQAVSRRSFGMLAIYAALMTGSSIVGWTLADQRRRDLLIAEGSSPLTATLPPTPERGLSGEAAVLPEGVPTSTPAPTERATISEAMREVHSSYRRQITTAVTALRDPHSAVIVSPFDYPELALNINGEVYQDGASMIKAFILIYAIFRDPELALNGWQSDEGQNIYRMVVSSNNTVTSQVLVDSVEDNRSTYALDDFNEFYHTILQMPNDSGLTAWGFGLTENLVTDKVQLPPESEDVERMVNPISLNLMADLYLWLESPKAVEGAVIRAIRESRFPLRASQYPTTVAYHDALVEAIGEARELLSIPDPEFVTDIEQAVRRLTLPAGVNIDLYGKNGVISPGDWLANRWQLNETVMITLRQGEFSAKYVVGFSSASFNTDILLDIALEYCVKLFGEQVLAT